MSTVAKVMDRVLIKRIAVGTDKESRREQASWL